MSITNNVLLIRLGYAASLLILGHVCVVLETTLRQPSVHELPPIQSSPAQAALSSSNDMFGAASCPQFDWKPPSNCPQSMVGNRTILSSYLYAGTTDTFGGVKATSRITLGSSSSSPASTSTRSTSTIISPSITETSLYTNDPTFAIAMIALGNALTSSTVVERAVQSIRRRGLYCGPILILTDHVNATKAASQRLARLTRSDPNVHPINVESRPNKMMTKRYKTELLDILDERSEYNDIRHLLYMDVDILVGETLQSFVGYVRGMTTMLSQPSRAAHVQSYMLMFEDQGIGPEKKRKQKSGNTVFHGGVLLLHRQRSRGCLAAWQTLFDDTERFPFRDQTALYHMLYKSKELKDKCTVEQMDHRPFLQMPSSETMKKGDASVFIHVTNGLRSKEIDDTLQADYYRCVIMVDEEYAVKSRFDTKKKEQERK